MDFWRRADLVERKTSISKRNANQIWRSNVENNTNVRGNSSSSRSTEYFVWEGNPWQNQLVMYSVLRTTSNISYSRLPTWTFHKVWRLTSPQQYLVSDDFSLRETRKQSKRPVLLPNQTSLRLISCIHVRFFETSLKLLWVTIVRTTRQVPDTVCTSVDPPFYTQWSP